MYEEIEELLAMVAVAEETAMSYRAADMPPEEFEPTPELENENESRRERLF